MKGLSLAVVQRASSLLALGRGVLVLVVVMQGCHPTSMVVRLSTFVQEVVVDCSVCHRVTWLQGR